MGLRYAVTDTDFDGLTCAWLFEKFENDIIVIPHSSRLTHKNGKYDWEWKAKDADFIYFADQCPEPWKLKELLDNGIDFQVIDHHGTSREAVAKYDKENGTNLMSKCIFEEGLRQYNPYDDEEVEKTQDAALSLVWDYFTDNAPRPPAIQYLNAFDTFRWWTAKDARELSKTWAEVFFAKGTPEQKAQLDEFAAEKDWKNFYALKDDIMEENRKSITDLLDHYLEIKTGEDGPDLESIDMSIDNFLEKAQEDISRGREKMETELGGCKEAKDYADVISLGGIEFLAVSQSASENLKSLHYSDVAGELAAFSPNKVAAIYWEQDSAGVRCVKFSLRVAGATSDEDMAPNIARIAEQYYFTSKNADGEIVKKTGGGHTTSASFLVNLDEKDKGYPDQIIFSDIMATARKPTNADLVCISSLDKEIQKTAIYKKIISSRAKMRKF